MTNKQKTRGQRRHLRRVLRLRRLSILRGLLAVWRGRLLLTVLLLRLHEQLSICRGQSRGIHAVYLVVPVMRRGWGVLVAGDETRQQKTAGQTHAPGR